MRRFTTSVSMMWRELPLAERFVAAKAAGFVGAEIQVPGEATPDEWRAAADASGLPVVLLNLDLGDFLAGGPGLSGVPGREEAFAAALETGLDMAERLNPAFLHIGPSRVPDGESREVCMAVYRVNAAYAHARAAARGITAQLVVEAVNRAEAPSALIGTTAEAAAICAALGGGTGVLFDLYHACAGGEDALASYRAHAGAIAHIQFSDLPGRQPPGRGSIDFAGLLTAIERAGYAGLWGAEYMSFSATGETLGWMEQLA